MWPFKRRRERDKLRAMFRGYVADELIDELINHPRPLRLDLQPASISFILLQVRDEPVVEAPDRMAKAIDIIQRRNGICDVMSSTVLAIFGFPRREDREKSSDQRAKSVARLVTELGPDIRLVYGTADGLVGNYGSLSQVHYGPLLPGFARYLSALTALEFGQSAEVPVT
ncbi:MAG: hypothetical protein C0484_27360 [Rhodospirillum sp.]|jgi:hypothetical protein|nr:hypothetical protein [Rhodospirillum sp.]